MYNIYTSLVDDFITILINIFKRARHYNKVQLGIIGGVVRKYVTEPSTLHMFF